MIYFSQAYDINKNIGCYYNTFMSLLPNDIDFGCFLDGDASYTTKTYGHVLYDIIEAYPECGVFTAMTNRIGCLWQRQPGVDPDNHDMRYHRRLGEQIQADKYTEIEDVTNKPYGEVLGGILILIRKDVWKRIGKFKDQGILGVDNDLHWKCQKHKEKVYLMKGIYLYHFYRGLDGSKSHLV